MSPSDGDEQPQLHPPHHVDTARKRVGKACDRCRMKKSKCDGASPCSRCKLDNSICVFGEKKKAHDKIYPKGYVEMLEQQQAQLVSGLQESYRRLSACNLWHTAPLEELQGHVLTHDILVALEVIVDSSMSSDGFEEDTQRMQQRVLDHGTLTPTRRSVRDSDPDRQSVRDVHMDDGAWPVATPFHPSSDSRESSLAASPGSQVAHYHLHHQPSRSRGVQPMPVCEMDHSLNDELLARYWSLVGSSMAMEESPPPPPHGMITPEPGYGQLHRSESVAFVMDADDGGRGGGQGGAMFDAWSGVHSPGIVAGEHEALFAAGHLQQQQQQNSWRPW